MNNIFLKLLKFKLNEKSQMLNSVKLSGCCANFSINKLCSKRDLDKKRLTLQAFAN